MADQDFIKEVFQRAAEEFDIEFNPVAWERMEKKLNRARRRRILFYWLRLGGLLMLGMLLTWLLWQQFAKPESKPNVAKPSIPVVVAPKAAEEFCPENQAIVGNLTKNEALKKEALTKNKKQSNPIKTQREQYAVLQKTNKKVNGAQINANKVALQEKNNTGTVDSFQNKRSNSFNDIALYNTEAIAAIELTTLTFEKPNETIIIPQPPDDSTDIIKPNPLPQNRWTVGAFIAPETASVGFNDVSRTGYSFGLLTEYRFAQRFSLSVQGLYAKKNYVAGAGEYTRKYGWPNGIAPIQTIGNCKMIEATLSLRTELIQKQRWNLVANTGVSTWWMLQEDYRYKYAEHNTVNIYKWKSKEPITHWFGVAQLGVGAEVKLSQKMSVQADLYMQVPLQGLGHGKLQLYSNGLSFSLRRHF